MAEIKTTLEFIKKSLTTNEVQHKELGDKIDHLSTTFQTRIGDKADQKIVMDRFDELDGRYVSRDTFGPVQKIVYGLTGGILIAFLGAIVALLFQ